jgi:uncharacterized protein DUF1918
MPAKQGDQIVIDTTTLDALRRQGEVIEVIGQGDREHYRIRWEDGHESVSSWSRTRAWCRRTERPSGSCQVN